MKFSENLLDSLSLSAIRPFDTRRNNSKMRRFSFRGKKKIFFDPMINYSCVSHTFVNKYIPVANQYLQADTLKTLYGVISSLQKE